MKRFRMIFISMILFFSLNSLAEIREAQSMRAVAKEVTPGTLVIFDLDNTVLEATQTLGTDQFFSHLVKKAEGLGLKDKEALAWALKESGVIQPVTNVKAVEPNTPYFVNALQSRGFTVFALTARAPIWRTGTLRQVHSLGIDFTKTSPKLSEAFAVTSTWGQYANGVLFLPPGMEKGAALLNFLRATHLKPNRVIFVDDKVNNVQSVDKALRSVQIPVIAFRYGAADERVRTLDSRIADFEYCYFQRTGVFLSDDVARKLIASGAEKSCR